MAKRNHDESQFIKINPLNSSDESSLSVAILNALVVLNAENVEGVKIPTRKELTKLLKNAKFENVCKALDEVNNIRIRKVPVMESTGIAGLIFIDHPVKPLWCTIYREQEIKDGEIKLINSGLGDDVVTLEEQVYNDRLLIDNMMYQVFVNTGEREEMKKAECSCNDCCRYAFEEGKDICLYDNSDITDTNYCCNKYTDCFKWKHLK